VVEVGSFDAEEVVVTGGGIKIIIVETEAATAT